MISGTCESRDPSLTILCKNIPDDNCQFNCPPCPIGFIYNLFTQVCDEDSDGKAHGHEDITCHENAYEDDTTGSCKCEDGYKGDPDQSVLCVHILEDGEPNSSVKSSYFSSILLLLSCHLHILHNLIIN